MAQQIAFTKSTVAVLGKGRMIRNAVDQIEATEPPIRQVQMNFFAQRRSDRMPEQ